MSLIDVLGSRTRLKIVRELSRGPKYVSELAETIGMDGSTARHHLATLEDHDLVAYYMIGNRKYYHLVKDIELTVAAPPKRRFILQATDVETTADPVDDPREAES